MSYKTSEEKKKYEKRVIECYKTSEEKKKYEKRVADYTAIFEDFALKFTSNQDFNETCLYVVSKFEKASQENNVFIFNTVAGLKYEIFLKYTLCLHSRWYKFFKKAYNNKNLTMSEYMYDFKACLLRNPKQDKKPQSKRLKQEYIVDYMKVTLGFIQPNDFIQKLTYDNMMSLAEKYYNEFVEFIKKNQFQAFFNENPFECQSIIVGRKNIIHSSLDITQRIGRQCGISINAPEEAVYGIKNLIQFIIDTKHHG